LIAEMSVLPVYLRMGISEVLADIIERRAKELGVGVLQASEEPSTEPVLACDDLAQYLQPLVLNEPPRINEYGSVSSVCTTLEAMLADLEELKTDTRHAGHYAFSVAALEAGLGFLFVRQWTGQKSAWTQAINLANTINCDYKADFPRATELIPAFAAHLKATATAKNPKAGLKSWKAADQEAHRDDLYVARRRYIAEGEQYVAAKETCATPDLEECRRIIFEEALRNYKIGGLALSPRHPSDDPVIVETWL
uniref:hypothetical protein n=1 Tax=Armatimonas sp. TaxID=1872638 RepID=UPI0037508321